VHLCLHRTLNWEDLSRTVKDRVAPLEGPGQAGGMAQQEAYKIQQGQM